MNLLKRQELLNAVIQNPEAVEELKRVLAVFCRDLRKALDALERAAEPIANSLESAMIFSEDLELEERANAKEHENAAD